MKNFKKDFPIFRNNPELIYLDSTATAQKPSYVIDSMKDYLENNYSNIHRWSYSIAEKSENMYIYSKKKVANLIEANSYKEIIYTYNSNYALNLLTASLKKSWYFKAWDKVLLSIVEHHANIVPWLMLVEETWIEVDYIKIKDDFSLDLNDLEKKLNDKVKIVSITHISNVTWEIFQLEKVWKIIASLEKKAPLFIVDASQSIPHMKVDVKKIWCDFLFFTAHKLMADSGIWVLWGKQDLLSKLKPAFSWWGAISWVKKTCFKEAPLPARFEPWTPNLTWALSLLKAIEYIENIWWYKKIESLEKEFNSYFLKKIKTFNKKVKLMGWINPNSRVSVFSFIVKGIHSMDIADYLAEAWIAIRAWQHCAEPFMWELWINHSCRASFYIYNSLQDIDNFFKVLDEAIELLS